MAESESKFAQHVDGIEVSPPDENMKAYLSGVHAGRAGKPLKSYPQEYKDDFLLVIWLTGYEHGSVAARPPAKGQTPDDGVKLFSRAPIGGVTIQGEFYPGGRFIPGEALEKATPAERAAIDKPAPAPKTTKATKPSSKPRAAARKPRETGTPVQVELDAKHKIKPPRGVKLSEEMAAVTVPPAWTDVHANFHPDADVLVFGFDKKGRKQAVYSKSHNMKQAAMKFNRVRALERRHAQVMARLRKDATTGDNATRDLASVMLLINATGIRPGSRTDTKAEKQAYGASTLRAEHVHVGAGNDVTLRFTGKKGVSLVIEIEDEDIARMLKHRKTLSQQGNGELFNVTDGALLKYVKDAVGKDHKVYDFRTLKGTESAAALVAQDKDCCKDEKAFRRRVKEVAKSVARVLGNTPAVALESYIDPMVFQKWRKGA